MNKLTRLIAVLFLAAALPVHAETYPDRRILVIAPFEAGASADIVVRLVTQRMSEILGQPFVVENRTGALGAIGTAEFAKAAPDGYTILYGNNGQITDITGACDAIRQAPLYDPGTFVPIGRAHQAFFTLVVKKDVPVRTLREFADYVRSNPGKLTYASGQPTAALVGGMLNSVLDLKLVVVQYRGDPAAMRDVVGGHVNITTSAEPVVAPQLAAGNITLLGGIGDARSPFHPELPLLAEQGSPEFAKLPSFGGFFGPPGFPAHAVEILNRALKQALEDPRIVSRMHTIGVGERYSTPQELGSLVANRATMAEFIRKFRIDMGASCIAR